MRRLISWVPLFIVLALVLPAHAAFDQLHLQLSAELKKYVDSAGVHYCLWHEHPEWLNQYLADLAAISPDEYGKFSESEKKALWINAYNAIIIKIVIDHYPIHGQKTYYPSDSARQIPSLWEAYRFRVAGQDVNLYDIEHKVIRKEFKDPRMHFAVVCAARGCPCLMTSAYTAATLERDLDKAAWQFMTDPSHVRFDREHKVVQVSRLFQWFPLDFNVTPQTSAALPPSDDEVVLAYVLSYAGREIQKEFADPKLVRVIYMPYNWSLNDADEK